MFFTTGISKAGWDPSGFPQCDSIQFVLLSLSVEQSAEHPCHVRQHGHIFSKSNNRKSMSVAVTTTHNNPPFSCNKMLS